MTETRRTRPAVGLGVDAVTWGGVAVTAVLLGVRAAGIEAGWRTAAALSVLPLLMLASAAALLVATGRRRWRQVAAATAVVLLAAPAMLPRMLTAAQPAASGPELVVAVANLKIGLADPARIVELVRDADIDVLVTLELSDEAVRRLREAGLDALLPHTVLEPTASRAGGGVHSRFPLTQTSPPTPDGGEPDVLIAVPGAEPVHLTTTHPRPPINASFADAWRAGIAALPDAGTADGAVGGPSLLAGDLNATLDHSELRGVLGRGWRDAAQQTGRGLHPTYAGWFVGSWTPPLVIDHVLVDDATAVRSTATHRLPGSDHRMLVAVLQLPAG